MNQALALMAIALWGFATPPIAAEDQRTASAKRDTPVAVGDTAPDFTLEDQDGRRHTLSVQRGSRPVVLVFYRGYW